MNLFCVHSQHSFKLPTSKPHKNYKFCNQNTALNTKVQIVFKGNVGKLEKPFNVSIITALRVLTPTALNACSKENYSQLEYPITTGVSNYNWSNTVTVTVLLKKLTFTLIWVLDFLTCKATEQK